MNVPESLRYAKSHEWLRLEDGCVGISDHAQGELSDVVFVDLPKVGRKVKAGETVAVVESVKAASDIYAPASGEVVEVNTALAENSSLVNTDPFGAGWMFKLKLDAPAETGSLLDAAGYRAQIGG